jgi:hypothetical protein
MRAKGRLLYEEPIFTFSYRKAGFIKAVLLLYAITTLLLIVFIIGVVDYSLMDLKRINMDAIKLTMLALMFFTMAGGAALLNYYIDKGGIQRVRIYDEAIVPSSVPIEFMWDEFPKAIPIKQVDKVGAGFDNANKRYVLKLYSGTYRYPWYMFEKAEYNKILQIFKDDLKIEIAELE